MNSGSTNRKHQIEKAKAAFLQGIGVPEKTTFVVDDFQREAISSVANAQDTLVVAPTGSGKTYIALEAIRAILQQGLRAVYTTPLKALSNTKFSELKREFGDKHKVGLLTGDRKIEGDAQVVVATTEIYRNELYRFDERFSLVILDEVHFIADSQRGPVWEESIILTPSSATLLMLSASISNADEISGWIAEVRAKPCRVVHKIGRPVELRYGFLHPDLGVLPLTDQNGQIFPEVREYYAAVKLDESGMRLRGGRFNRPRGWENRGRSNRRGGRGGRPRR